MWEELESPPVDLQIVVTTWVMNRHEDPYQGARRQPGFDNLWFAEIPGSVYDDRNVVVCSYFIDEIQRTVRCSNIATLSRPV